MAITWKVDIENVDVSKKRADVNITRVDDVTGDQENYSFRTAIIGTNDERLALLDLAWSKHLEAVAEKTTVDNFITNLEHLGKSNLEAREV